MKNGTSNNWGFIDAKGKIVIPANYNRVGDFHGGYCWVEEKVGSRDWILIDTKGREVYRTTETSPGQVGDNIFYLEILLSAKLYISESNFLKGRSWAYF